MKKTYKFLAITAMAITLSMNNLAIAKEISKKSSESIGFKVAIVDIKKVVESSPSINALKTDRINKLNELTAFVERAKEDVSKETNAAKKKTLEDSYNKELNLRKDAIDKNYAEKLSAIDKQITAVIKAKSKECGYNLILTNTTVLDGGTDITTEIIKELK